VANVLHNLAKSSLKHRYAEADSLYRRSLAITEKSLGPKESEDPGRGQNELFRVAAIRCHQSNGP